jgi:alpha-L-fucosidase
MRPVESIVVRGIPARRVEQVTLLGSGETLAYRASFEVHDSGGGHGDDALGELTIRAPQPTNALIDVVAIDFAASLPPGVLDRPDG